MAAQGRPMSAKGPTQTVRLTTKVLDDDDSTSSTSSDSDTSSHHSQSNKPKSGKAFKDPNEDFQQYTQKMAKQEWLYATGQSGIPVPPPKPAAASSAAVAGSPVVPRPGRPTASSSPPPVQAAPPAAQPQSAAPAAVPHKVNTTPATYNYNSPSRSAGPTQPPVIASPARDVAVSPKDNGVKASQEPPPASALVTDEEETSNPGRRDFLKLLDLFGEEKASRPSPQPAESSAVKGSAAPAVTVAKPVEPANPDAVLANVVPIRKPKNVSEMSLPQLTQWHFDRLYDEWLEQEEESPFVALEYWQKAEAYAVIEKSSGTDPGEIHQILRQSKNRETHNGMLDQTLRFNAAVDHLETFVMSDSFVSKVNQFLHKHHKTFLLSKPARERGEYQHKDHEVFSNYCKLMESLMIGDLKRNVDGFDEEEFFELIFDPPQFAESQPSDGSSSPSSSSRSVSALSFEVWEVLLSFLKFENFCELMDEYINTHYGVKESGPGVGSLRRSPPPPSAPATNKVPPSTAQLSSKPPQAAASPATVASKPKGGSTIGGAPAIGASKPTTSSGNRPSLGASLKK